MSKGRTPRQRPPTIEERAAAYLEGRIGAFVLSYAHDNHCPLAHGSNNTDQCCCDPDISLVSVATGETLVRWLPANGRQN